MNIWYAQTQAQARQGQYPRSPIITFAQPSTQLGVKLSKLVKEARQLGCETFFGLVYEIMVRNWLKKVSDTLPDMELKDDLKLRVATRLMDKSVVTWWDNLKLQTITLITWDLIVQEFNEKFYTWFHRDQKRQEFFRLKQFGKIVTDYEIELRDLANFEVCLCSNFEEDLSLEIKEKMSILGSQSFKEMVQLALRVEKLTSEKMSQGKF